MRAWMLCATAALFCSRAALATPMNLITNGDFSSGNTGFTSQYTYVTGAASANPEGTYSVVTKANDVHNSWGSYYDHTSGNSSGKYFVANGSTDTTKTVWQSNLISVTQPNTAYRFEAYLMAIYPFETNYPVLSFQIGDGTNWTNMGTTASLNSVGPGHWLFTYADGQFTSAGNYYVRLKNSNSGAGGNDLGLDDIYFGLRTSAPSVVSTPGVASPPSLSPQAAVPEIDPAGFGSVAALVTGAIGLIERRRRAA